MYFEHRHEAGRVLGTSIAAAPVRDPVVIGLARGGVPVARGVASVLGAPLDVMVVRQVYARGEPGTAIGAVAPSVLYLDEAAIARLPMAETWLRTAVIEEMAALRRRERVYRQGRPPIEVEGRSVILVDDILDFGYKERVAIWALRQREPAEIILAAPFCTGRAAARLAALVDRLVVLRPVDDDAPTDSGYAEASTTDAQVLEALRPASGSNSEPGLIVRSAAV